MPKLTGSLDTDIYMLACLGNEEFNKIIGLGLKNKYINKLVRNEKLYRSKLEQSLPELLQFRPVELSYRNFYLMTSKNCLVLAQLLIAIEPNLDLVIIDKLFYHNFGNDTYLQNEHNFGALLISAIVYRRYNTIQALLKRDDSATWIDVDKTVPINRDHIDEVVEYLRLRFKYRPENYFHQHFQQAVTSSQHWLVHSLILFGETFNINFNLVQPCWDAINN